MDVEPSIDLGSDGDAETQVISGNGLQDDNGAGELNNDVDMLLADEQSETAVEVGEAAAGDGAIEPIDDFDLAWRESRPSLSDKFAFALDNKRIFHDVVFSVGEEKALLSAHKTILAISSSVFESLFYGPKAVERDETQPIILGDLEANAFRATLKFIYTGVFDVDLLDAVGVLRAAKMFDLPDLLTKAGEFLIRNLTEQNAITFYQAAELFDVKNLEESACSFLLNNFWAVAKTEDFLNISFQNLCKFLDMDEINISELEFFNAAMKWAKFQCEKQDMKDTSENLRAVLQDAIALIRFTLMSPKEFALQIVPKFILSPIEVITIFQHLSVDLDDREGLPSVFCKSESRKKLKYSSVGTNLLVENVKSTRLRVRIRPCDRFTAIQKDSSVNLGSTTVLVPASGRSDPTYTPPSAKRTGGSPALSYNQGSSSGRKRTSH